MKKWRLTILLLVLISGLKAQTFSEWFRQNKTQKKYLLEQIAALDVYSVYLQKGYAIAKDGLNTINSIRHSEFDLHGDHFKSLKRVNPAINKLIDMGRMNTLQDEIITVSKNALKAIRKSTSLTAGEASYINLVFAKLLEKAKANRLLLQLLLPTDELQLTDDERLERINVVYKEMQEMAVFARSFAGAIDQLILQRIKEQEQTESIRRLINVER